MIRTRRKTWVNWIISSGALLTAALAVTAQNPAQRDPSASAIFTKAQAEAGRAAYENTCGKCHTFTLRGRKGDPGELPALSSLPPDYQKTVQTYSGMIPPLVGADFLSHWGSHTAADLTKRLQEAIGGFPPEGSNDETAVNITAYVLQANGANPGTQPLTSTTSVIVNAVVAEQPRR